MSCDGAYATAQAFAKFWCMDPMCMEEKDTIESFLGIAAADIHVALAATGACGCTLSSYGLEYLKKLNIIEAAIIYNCPCGSPRHSQEAKEMWLNWIDNQFKALREQTIDVCANATGADFPAIGIAQQGIDDFSKARIIARDIEVESA